ncbi:hypothetical protein SAMN04487949_1758 [Halogranum gelatinilyticum]|uniref:DUF8071 domain-containing protein n=1 Tax=Halogranum gelatinilyticum TaxID=660521 RepID=A0A1G9TFX0_9EURY|nr:hypothetical protein [Halogranum gelatinilyticum]SDM46626.1 hypothetical protein SAMN04487949_1758 [Halogranum gelatinilyticum]
MPSTPETDSRSDVSIRSLASNRLGGLGQWLGRQLAAVGHAAAGGWRQLRWLAVRIASLLAGGLLTVLGATGTAATSDRGRRLAKAFGGFLFGQRVEVTFLTVLLAPVLALATAWWIGTGIGYHAVEAWFVGTWTGTDPNWLLFVAGGVLVGIGATSAAFNSGLVPTVLLVAAPVFGLGTTRYGTTPAYHHYNEVVSLPSALEIGAILGVSFGVPLGVAGFLLGVSLRRVLGVLTARHESLALSESA